MKYSEILTALKVDELKALCHQFCLFGYSKLKKDELVEFIAEEVLKVDFLEDAFLRMSDEEYDVFTRVYNKEKNIPESHAMNDLQQVGFICGKDGKYTVPTDIASKFKKICTEDFIFQRVTLNNMIELAAALTNLCGVITLEKYNEMLKRLYDYDSSAEESEKILSEYFAIKDGRILNAYFDECDCDGECGDEDEHAEHEQAAAELAELLHKQESCTIAELPKEELLNYADECYYENDIQTDAMIRYLKNELHIDDGEAENLCCIIIMDCRIGSNIEGTLNVMKVGGYEFKSEKQIQGFSKVYMQVYHSTRMWAYCGHTPDEIRGAQPTLRKIGRNDPCPCGSGKKYKKCCGK